MLALAVAVGAGGAIAHPEKTVAGHAVVAEHEYIPLGAEAYVRSPERNDKIGNQADSFAQRILEDAQAHPERVRFQADEKGTAHTGTLIDSFSTGGKTYSFSVKARDNNGDFALSRGSKSVAVDVRSDIPNKPGRGRVEEATYERTGQPGDDGYEPWVVGIGVGTFEKDGPGGSSGDMKVGLDYVHEQPGVPVPYLVSSEVRTEQLFAQSLAEAGL